VVDGVVAGAADERVVAVAAEDAVVTGAAVERVGKRIAGEAVFAGAAGDVLEALHRVAVARQIGDRAGAVAAGVERQRHAVVGVGQVGVVQRIDTEAAVEGIVAVAAGYDVVVLVARGVAAGRVGAAGQVAGLGVERRLMRQVDGHPDAGVLVAQRVGAEA